MPFKYNYSTGKLDYYEETTLPVVPDNQVFFSTSLPTDGGVVFTPNTPELADTLYISEVTGQVYIYNDPIYTSYTSPIPNNTAWYMLGTTIDAGGKKTIAISRPGPITVGSDSTFSGVRIGRGAGGTVTNTLLGLNSLVVNTSGSYNTAIGREALTANTTGFANTAIGSRVLYTNLGGQQNVAIGDTAMYFNTSGTNNVAVGVNSLYRNTSGGNNTALGYQSGAFLVDGTTNNIAPVSSVFIGSLTRSLTYNDINQIVIGYAALGKGSNTVQIGSASITDTYLQGILHINNAYTLPTTAPTVDQVLGYSSPGISAWITGSGSLAGNVLFVSSAGSDADVTRAGHLGDAKKPFLTLQAARNAAISGDLIYVFPQYFIFDNSAGVYDSNINDLNLWKDGVTYYWSPGCKLKFISCVANPTNMSLFKPSITVYETCSSIGYLEYEQYSVAPSNGKCYYFNYTDPITNVGTTTGTDYGCTFFSQTKSQIGYGGSMIILNRGNSTNTSSIMDITIISDFEQNVWVIGHSGGSNTYSLLASTAADCPINFKSYVRDRKFSNQTFITCRNMWGPSSYLQFSGETLKQDGFASANRIIELRITSTVTISFEVKRIYYSTVHVSTVNACIVSDDLSSSSQGSTINMKGDLFPSAANANPVPLFSLFYNTTINYEGNIYTKTNGSIGNTIVTLSSSTSAFYMKGNIGYLGTTVSTNPIFKTNTGSLLKFSGNISGNFAGAIAQCGTGTIEISNSNIKSTTAGAGSYFFLNGGTSLGTIRINNSYIELNNSTNPIADGAYVKTLINNSTLVNSGASAGIANSTNFGLLQVANSMVYATSLPVNYTGTAAVTVTNASTNSAWSVATTILGGTLDIIPSLTF